MKSYLEGFINLLNRFKIKYVEDELLSLHSTFKIGGPCDLFVVPDNEDELITVLSDLSKSDINYIVVGRGSNSLYDDAGFRGVVVSTENLDAVSISGDTITFGVGYQFTKAAIFAETNGLSGLEFAYGIPGFVGGAVYMNAGAYGGEVSQVLIESRYYDALTDTIDTFKGEEHCFGYRTSVYKDNPQFVILSATFKLVSADRDAIKNTMNDFMSRRREKQPLEYPSGGSVFKRPEGYFAGKLIEDCGLKGYRIGGAEVSEKHAGFIVNKGGATCNDVLSLISHIQSVVMEKYGVMLECELIHVK